MLVRSQELFLAFYVAHSFYRKAVKEVAMMLAERAEKYFQADICMKLLENHVKDQDYIDLVHNRLLRVGVVRRPANITQEDEQRLQQA